MGKRVKLVEVEREKPAPLISFKKKALDFVALDDIAPVSKSRVPRAVGERRNAAIAGYVGFNGSAKSATMVRDTLPDLEAGRNVLSTVALLSFDKAKDEDEAFEAWEKIGALDCRPSDSLALPHPNWIPFKDWRQVMDFTNGVILMDEVSGIADAREASAMPVQVANLLFQLRRRDVVLRWTTIDWSAADKRIRRATQTVTLCRGYFSKKIPGRVWKQKRLFQIRTFDARGFEDFTAAVNRVSDKQRPKPQTVEWVRLFGGLSKAIRAYSSEAPVLSLSSVNEAGMCLDCGGKRSLPRCSCKSA